MSKNSSATSKKRRLSTKETSMTTETFKCNGCKRSFETRELSKHQRPCTKTSL